MNLKSVDYVGACIVLCNYLDGVVADYEENNVDNLDLILSAIKGLKELGDPEWKVYYDRVKKIKRK